MIAFSFGFMAQAGAKPSALRGLLWNTHKWERDADQIYGQWKEDSSCFTGTHAKKGRSKMSGFYNQEDCLTECKNKNAIACQWDIDVHGGTEHVCYYYMDKHEPVTDCTAVLYFDEEMDAPCDTVSGRGEECYVFREPTPRPTTTTTTTTTTTATTRTVIPQSAKDDFEGCFDDSRYLTGGERDLKERIGTRSYAECKSECSQYRYFGLQWHSICFCGNSRGSSGRSTNCKKDCSTTENFQGDGANANCVFRTGATLTKKITTTIATPHPHSANKKDFAGCWKRINPTNEKELALPSRVASGDSGLSFAQCKSRCSAKSKGRYTYFGRYGNNQCYCGRKEKPYGESTESNCKCETENNLTANKWAICVYEIKENIEKLNETKQNQKQKKTNKSKQQKQTKAKKNKKKQTKADKSRQKQTKPKQTKAKQTKANKSTRD